jgi:hypothetical protein
MATNKALKIRRIAAAAAISVVSVAGGLVATSAPAAASGPTNCMWLSHYPTPGYADAFCTGGVGYFRSVAWCSAHVTGGFTYIWGPIVAVGNTGSRARCTSAKPYLRGGNVERFDQS